MFIQMLEGLHPEEAKIICLVKDKSLTEKYKITKELAKELEKIGIKIAKEAWTFAMHAGRKTIKAEDIEIAVSRFMGK